MRLGRFNLVEDVRSMAVQVVVFSLGQEEYAMPIEVVLEITRLDEVVKIPQAPSYVCGLINLRGIAVPLIDLHVRFGIDRTEDSMGDSTMPQDAFALITEVQGTYIGFAVDQVREVRILESIDPPPLLVTSPFIAGIVNLRDRIIIQLIPEQILGSNEVQGLSKIAI
jgi:purine-binding chemotaxis protein CheW